jgi:YidC/Oxa1 family membrane protein insertase
MNLFQESYRLFVYEPQLNLLQWIFSFTHDTGLAIIILSLIVNLLMLPLYISAYINGQKVRLLQPQMQSLRNKYKNDQQEYVKHLMEFNKKHGISNGSTFMTLFVQIFFLSGLFVLVRDVVEQKNLTEYLYPFIRNLNIKFTTKAFDFLPLNGNSRNYIWLPLIAAFFSFLMGLYLTKFSPKIVVKTNPKDSKTKTSETLLDPEAFEKSMEFNQIFLFPIIMFTFNYTLSVGLNLYLVTSGLVSLIRQIFITQYFKSNIEDLKKLIEDSDPIFHDQDKSNDYQILEVKEKNTTSKKAKNKGKIKASKIKKKKRLNP